MICDLRFVICDLRFGIWDLGLKGRAQHVVGCVRPARKKSSRHAPPCRSLSSDAALCLPSVEWHPATASPVPQGHLKIARDSSRGPATTRTIASPGGTPEPELAPSTVPPGRTGSVIDVSPAMNRGAIFSGPSGAACQAVSVQRSGAVFSRGAVPFADPCPIRPSP